jgi:hypothetical protein
MRHYGPSSRDRKAETMDLSTLSSSAARHFGITDTGGLLDDSDGLDEEVGADGRLSQESPRPFCKSNLPYSYQEDLPDFGASSLVPRPKKRLLELDVSQQRNRIRRDTAFHASDKPIPFFSSSHCRGSFEELLLQNDARQAIGSGKRLRSSPYMHTPLPSYPHAAQKRHLQLDTDHWPRNQPCAAKKFGPLSDGALEDIIQDFSSFAVRPRKHLRQRSVKAANATPEPETGSPTGTARIPSSVISTPALSRASSVSSVDELSAFDYCDLEVLQNRLSSIAYNHCKDHRSQFIAAQRDFTTYS